MIVARKELIDICESLRSDEKEIVFTNGCFDIIHSGHVIYLHDAKSYGDVLIVGLNSDESVRRLKGANRPLNSENDRAVVLDTLKPVDYVCVFDEDTPLELIKAIKPDVLVKGGDYTRDTIVGADVVEQNGGKVIVVPLLEGRSTTTIIEKMKSL
ncbi:D-glycero-beta-D-manno-heptose 1-phosphate adenylyltransferase [Bacteroidetes/Chlorobi group bacterium ChocPot_Mid]|jgi:rfaE bifunctional protein nucleotidyltransferase chain/domain|nr:MAG: D-glycero-beta-D-manno-heptose 1-phosphate adenylyltransferase [Bacteroidetes/Chlorobi group bacterium ChocPot_Mid]